ALDCIITHLGVEMLKQCKPHVIHLPRFHRWPARRPRESAVRHRITCGGERCQQSAAHHDAARLEPDHLTTVDRGKAVLRCKWWRENHHREQESKPPFTIHDSPFRSL